MKDSKINIILEVDAYRNHLIIANFKDSTVSMYCRILEKFLTFVSKIQGEEELCQNHAQTYLLR